MPSVCAPPRICVSKLFTPNPSDPNHNHLFVFTLPPVKGKGKRLSPSALLRPANNFASANYSCCPAMRSYSDRYSRCWSLWNERRKCSDSHCCLHHTHIGRCRVRVQVRIDICGIAVGSGAIATSKTDHRKQTHND